MSKRFEVEFDPMHNDYIVVSYVNKIRNLIKTGFATRFLAQRWLNVWLPVL